MSPIPGLTGRVPWDKVGPTYRPKERFMANPIAWKSESEIDNALYEAKGSGKRVLLDFSHAPQ
jgi:hypothetical protein